MLIENYLSVIFTGVEAFHRNSGNKVGIFPGWKNTSYIISHIYTLTNIAAFFRRLEKNP